MKSSKNRQGSAWSEIGRDVDGRMHTLQLHHTSFLRVAVIRLAQATNTGLSDRKLYEHLNGSASKTDFHLALSNTHSIRVNSCIILVAPPNLSTMNNT